ncbi:adenosylcobalamin-dependent ribonucleoside-diphosphate reductase [bacterium]|nr:adenosylcobalamin-dependent ribonucleoside-diphosphate reductase [bacterium]
MFTENALRVLEKRYLMRDKKGNVTETPAELFKRVAKAVARAEKTFGASKKEVENYKDKFYQMMIERKFIPNTPTLMNAGKANGQLSACFVLPVPDNLEGIFETCKHAALIHKTGGGTGFSFSRLRPANDFVSSNAGVASGPVSFMNVYDAATHAIRQGGTRRGANMAILRVDHPDIEEFITCKKDRTKLNNFNISVAITDKFMQAFKSNSNYDLIHPGSGEVVRQLNARAIFDMISENAHESGEPGIVFIDRINASDPIYATKGSDGEFIPGTEDIEATNPCGEQPLGPGDACNLGSINLSLFVNEKQNDFNWDELSSCIELSVRFLDNVVEENNYPFQFIADATKNNRRIGLGVMGFAEALILMKIAYNSQEALEKAELVMQFLQEKAHQSSSELATTRGVFPNWKYSRWAEQGKPMRNATVTTIAPTGTISVIAGTSSGIEPLFAVSYIRRVLGGEELIEFNSIFEKVASEAGINTPSVMSEISESGMLGEIDGIPDDIKRIFVCSHEISYEWHVKMQAVFQKFTDNAVSKTINFPADAKVEHVEAAYKLAWDLNLKGITVYRDTSRSSQVLNVKKTDPKSSLPAPVKSPAACLDLALVECDHCAPVSSNSALSNLDLSYLNSISMLRKCPECGDQSTSFMKIEACELYTCCGYTKC